MKKAIFFICFMLGFFVNIALASSISVYPMAADLTAAMPYQDLQVQNTGDDTAYVELSIYRLNNAGTPTQNFTELNDNPYQVGLIATPNKMVIPAGQMRMARVLYIGKPASSDIVYEVKLTPVSGQLVTIGTDKTNVTAGVQLIIAYGVAIYVRPVNLNPNINSTRNGTSLTLSNTGNTTVLIGDCKQCVDTSCTAVPTLNAHLYPGNNAHFTLPKDLPVQCQKEVLQNEFSNFTIH